MLNIKKKIRALAVTTAILCLSVPVVATAGHWYRVEGTLKTSVHYVPILKDTATASTSITNPHDWPSAQSKTYAYAYDKSGKCVSGSASASDYKAVESWSSGHAKATIRAMVTAKGTHKAKSDCTDNKWVTVNTSWKK